MEELLLLQGKRFVWWVFDCTYTYVWNVLFIFGKNFCSIIQLKWIGDELLNFIDFYLIKIRLNYWIANKSRNSLLWLFVGKITFVDASLGAFFRKVFIQFGGKIRWNKHEWAEIVVLKGILCEIYNLALLKSCLSVYLKKICFKVKQILKALRIVMGKIFTNKKSVRGFSDHWCWFLDIFGLLAALLADFCNF